MHGKKGIECIQCHFPPGAQNAVKQKFKAASMLVAFITGTYKSAPLAEIQDASCMRPGCHETRLLEGKVDFKAVVTKLKALGYQGMSLNFAVRGVCADCATGAPVAMDAQP